MHGVWNTTIVIKSYIQNTIRFLLFVISASLLITGCVGHRNSSGYSMQETMFASMMIPHHQQAIVMSEIALTNTTNPDVLALANEIKAAQAPEIEQMKKWGEVDTDMHSGHVMSGMLTDEELSALRTAQGKDFDRLFLEGMIKHHEGAILMTEMIVDSKKPDVASLAQSIITTQKAEIERMKVILGK